MDKLAEQNDQVHHLFVCVDVLSRFIRVETMKNKEADTAKNALMKMLTKGEQPKYIWVDDGKEFLGVFKKLCENLGIQLYSTKSLVKAAYAERAIRSLKNLIYRYMENSNTFRYITRLPSLVSTMNSRENRSIRMAPKDVTNRDVIRILNSRSVKILEPILKIGGYVRAVLKNTVFTKGYKPQFSREIHTIKSFSTRNPVTYILQDKDKKVLKGRFYENQLIHYAI